MSLDCLDVHRARQVVDDPVEQTLYADVLQSRAREDRMQLERDRGLRSADRSSPWVISVPLRNFSVSALSVSATFSTSVWYHFSYRSFSSSGMGFSTIVLPLSLSSSSL